MTPFAVLVTMMCWLSLAAGVWLIEPIPFAVGLVGVLVTAFLGGEP